MRSPTALSKSHKRSGLTLVELVLAVGMFSFLMASVGHLVLMSLRVQQSWGRMVLPAQSAERALNRLAQDLQAAQPLFGAPFQVASGGAGLEFARLGTAGWCRVVYRMEPDGDAKRLVREEWLWKTGEPSGEPLHRETLTRLSAGQFTVGRMNADDLLEWTASWDGEADGIPRLIKLEVTLPAIGAGQPITLSRVIRNPSGTLPKPEQP
ncbi:MAG: type II secretion system protein GspJ [Candidatus Omnitrophota bacterium]|nr:type II secretion system protein GspJ [Candidatus Omnitrophota bacterium]